MSDATIANKSLVSASVPASVPVSASEADQTSAHLLEEIEVYSDPEHNFGRGAGGLIVDALRAVLDHKNDESDSPAPSSDEISDKTSAG